MSEKKNISKVIVKAEVYDILRYPILSEKVAKFSEQNKVAFAVDINSSKTDISKAFEAIYAVKPLKINTVVIKGKEKTFRNKFTGVQKKVKKAYISLPKDSKIDFTAKL